MKKNILRKISLALAIATIFSCISLTSCKNIGETPETNSVAVAKDYIEGNWKLSRVMDVQGTEGTAMSKSDYVCADETWINATVPGTVLTSYLDQGLISDPYVGTTMQELENSGYYNCDYWYRTEFTVNESYTGKRVWLNFDGINWKADVYVNGNSIGNIAGAFIRGKFDITDYVTVGTTNYLAVYIHYCNSDVEDMPSFLCSAGWDTMPPIPGRNMGIYKDVYLSATADVTVDDPFVKVDLPLPDVSSAKLNVSADVTNHGGSTSGKLVCEITPKDVENAKTITFEKEVSLKKSETQTVTFDEQTLTDPLLWWPNGYGEQNLYNCKVYFVSGDTVSDVEETTFGVREFSYDTEALSDMIVYCNGVKIFCSGGCWCITEAMLNWSDEQFDTAVKYQADMGITMVRTWHGTSDFTEFYDACDKYGIMVYEDFWLNGYVCPEDVDMFMENVVDKVKRLRNYACLAIWCGENEATPPAPLNRKIPEAIEEYDNTRYYIDSSNADEVSGGVTYSIQDPSWYFDQSNGFTTEIGCVSVPNAESIIRMMGSENAWPVGNDTWKFHDYDADIGNKLPEKYTANVNGRYGTATDIYDFCKKAQLINYETYKAIYEAWNDQMWTSTSGLLLWMSNPAWPSTIWQTYDYYMEQNGAYFGTKTANEMTHIQWNSSTGSVKAINKTAADLGEVTATATVYNIDGTVAFDRTAKLNAPANSATEAFMLFEYTGVNLAKNKTATASSIDRGEFSAARAVDGKADTRWAASGRGNEWLQIDLGSEQLVDRVEIAWENAYASRFAVMVSVDGENWTTVDSKNDAYGGTTIHNFDVVTVRYVKINCIGAGTIYPYSIYEVRVIEAGTTNTEGADISDVHFIKLNLTDKDGNTISDNFYWRSNSGIDYTEINSLSKATLVLSSERVEAEEGKTKIKVTIKNDSSVIALAIRLKAIRDNAAEGEDNRILPCDYEDNYISLTPGEETAVTLEFDNEYLYGGNPELRVSGYNTDEYGWAI